MKTYYVKSNRNQQVRSLLAFKGEVQLIEYDFSPWVEDNSVIDSIEYSVKTGQASIAATDESITEDIMLFNGKFLSGIILPANSFYEGDLFTVSGSLLNDGDYITLVDNTANSLNSTVAFISESVSGYDVTISHTIDQSVKRALVTTNEVGSSMIKITVTANDSVFVTHLKVVCKDPEVVNTLDYT